jgi:hypothetical protein
MKNGTAAEITVGANKCFGRLGVHALGIHAQRIRQLPVLHPAHKPDNQGDDKNSSKDAAEIHRNLLLTSEDPIKTDTLSAVGALPHIDLSNPASK